MLTPPHDFESVKAALEAAGFKPDHAEVTMRPENSVPLSGEDAERMQKLLDARVPDEPVAEAAAAPAPVSAPVTAAPVAPAADVMPALTAIRRMLAEALGADRP